MKTAYDNEKRIVVFKNDKFEPGSDKPLYWGWVWINGTQYRVSLWGKIDGQGRPYYQGQVQVPEQQQQEMEFEDQTQATAKKKSSK